MKRFLRKLFKIRSPMLESLGYYHCQNCTRHEDCEGDERYVMCKYFHGPVHRYHTCKHFKRIKIKSLCKKRPRGLRANVGIIDEWSGFTMTKDKETKDGN